jgi:hypothetical protein
MSEIVLDIESFDGLLFGQYLLKKHPELWNVPLPMVQLLDTPPMCFFGRQVEHLEEAASGELDLVVRGQPDQAISGRLDYLPRIKFLQRH